MPEAQPPTVICLESRRGAEMVGLLRRRGLEAISAPSMQEVPLSDQAEALAFGETLLARELDIMVLLTGVGTRMLVDAIATRHPMQDVLAALGAAQCACRGPKPVAVLKQWGLRPAVVAPAPNTYLELLRSLDAELPVAGKRVVVQEYGQRNEALLEGLRERGAEVRPVPVYGWMMPDDTGPLQEAVRALLADEADAIAFTSQQQVHNLLAVADTLDARSALLEALAQRVLLASIGPVTSGALEAVGLRADLEPGLGKMGHLVKLIAERGAEALATKRSAAAGGV